VIKISEFKYIENTDGIIEDDQQIELEKAYRLKKIQKALEQIPHWLDKIDTKLVGFDNRLERIEENL